MCACQDAPLVTLSEAAVMLCVDYDTVLQWTRKGVFGRIVRVGPHKGLRLYRVDVLQQIRTEPVARLPIPPILGETA